MMDSILLFVMDSGNTSLPLPFRQPVLQVINDIYGGRVNSVENRQVVADIVAERHQAYHLAQEAITLAVHELIFHTSTLKKLAGYLVAELNALVERGCPQQNYLYLGDKLRWEWVADGGIKVELGEHFVESPRLAVFIELGLPAVRRFRGNTGAINHRQTAVQTLSQLFGRVGRERRFFI